MVEETHPLWSLQSLAEEFNPSALRRSMSGLVGAMAPLVMMSFVFKVRPLEAARTRAGSDTLWQKARSDVGGLIRWATAWRPGDAHFRSGRDSLLDCGLAAVQHSTRGLYPSNLTGSDGFLLAAWWTEKKKKRKQTSN
jgi:hypothetical protein